MKKNKIKHLSKIDFIQFKPYSIMKCLIFSKDEIALTFINGEIGFYDILKKTNFLIKIYDKPINNFFRIEKNLFFTSSDNIIKIIKIFENKKYEIIQEFSDLNFIKISGTVLSNCKLLLCVDYQLLHIYSKLKNKELFQKELSTNIFFKEGISFYCEISKKRLLLSNKNNIFFIYNFYFEYVLAFSHYLFPKSHNFLVLKNELLLFTLGKIIYIYDIKVKNIIKEIEMQIKIEIFYKNRYNTFLMIDNQYNLKEFQYEENQMNFKCILEKRKAHNNSISQVIKFNENIYITVSHDGIINLYELY